MQAIYGDQGCPAVFRSVNGTLNALFESIRQCDIMFYSAPANNTVGFIGLGNMGKGMAENLVTKVKGHCQYRQLTA